MSELDEGQAIRARLRGEIDERIGQYLDTYDGYEGGYISAWYLVAEVVMPEGGGRTIVEVSDEHSSKYTAMGLLFAALHDSRWIT